MWSLSSLVEVSVRPPNKPMTHWFHGFCVTAVVDCQRRCKPRAHCPREHALLRIDFTGTVHHHLADIPTSQLRTRWLFGPRVDELTS